MRTIMDQEAFKILMAGVPAPVTIVSTMHRGEPKKFETQVGPVTAQQQQHRRVVDYIDIAKQEGAKVLLGGGLPEDPAFGDGWFVQPTIFGSVNNRMRTAQEEVFGPVLSVIPFEDEDEAIAIGNDIDFGLAAGVWTSSIP